MTPLTKLLNAKKKKILALSVEVLDKSLILSSDLYC